MFLFHISKCDSDPTTGLRLMKAGIENTHVELPFVSGKKCAHELRFDRTFEIFKSLDIFRQFSEAQLRQAYTFIEVEAFAAGAVIISKGDIGQKFFIVLDGIGRVFTAESR